MVYTWVNSGWYRHYSDANQSILYGNHEWPGLHVFRTEDDLNCYLVAHFRRQSIRPEEETEYLSVAIDADWDRDTVPGTKDGVEIRRLAINAPFYLL